MPQRLLDLIIAAACIGYVALVIVALKPEPKEKPQRPAAIGMAVCKHVNGLVVHLRSGHSECAA